MYGLKAVPFKTEYFRSLYRRRVPHVPPDFLSNLVALPNFMRLSLQKAAHVNLADATCRKSGSRQRTWPKTIFSNAFAPSVSGFSLQESV
jgi:hypothetical protein